jgi:hypothetical protein
MDAAVVASTSIVATAVVAAIVAKVAEGIEAPSKRAIERVRTHEGVSVKPRVPIPAGRVSGVSVVPREVGVGVATMSNGLALMRSIGLEV